MCAYKNKRLIVSYILRKEKILSNYPLFIILSRFDFICNFIKYFFYDELTIIYLLKSL